MLTRVVREAVARRAAVAFASTSAPQLGPVARRIEAKLREKLQPAHLDVVDESSQRSGGSMSVSSEEYFCIDIVSPKFEGKSLVARHRMIYDVLADELRARDQGGAGVHSLRFTRTKSPKEV